MKREYFKFRILILICCMALPMLTFAQPDPPDDTPIDGGLSVLVAAGVAYGVKKYRDAKKKGEEEPGDLK